MGYSYQYDESGLASSYLAISLVIPLTIYFTYHIFTNEEDNKLRCGSSTCLNRTTKGFGYRHLVTFVLWVFLAYFLNNIRTIKFEIKREFDPLEILGIDVDTPEKEIKKKLKRLLIKYDIKKAPEGKEEEFEEARTQISKAYNIVKNKRKFNRWLNNESKSGEIMAIPDIIMKNATFAFIIYCVVLSLLLPRYAYKKWKDMNEKNRVNVYFETVEVLLRYFNDDLRKKTNEPVFMRNLISILSRSREFCIHNFTSDVKDLKDAIESDFAVPIPDLKSVNTGYLVLNDHIFRTKKCNKDDLEYIQEKSLAIIEVMKYISLSKGYAEILKKIFTLQAMVVQAVFDEDYFLLQYPKVSFTDLYKLKSKKTKHLNEDVLRMILEEKEFKVIHKLMNDIPKIQIEEFVASVKNTGDLDDEASDVGDEDPDDVKIECENIEIQKTKINSFKVKKDSEVSIRIRTSILGKDSSVHSHHLFNPRKHEWAAFIIVDNVLHKSLKILNGEQKDIHFDFLAPKNKKSSEVKLCVMDGFYFKNNVEQSILLKYV